MTDTEVSIERVNLALYDSYVVTGPRLVWADDNDGGTVSIEQGGVICISPDEGTARKSTQVGRVKEG